MGGDCSAAQEMHRGDITMWITRGQTKRSPPAQCRGSVTASSSHWPRDGWDAELAGDGPFTQLCIPTVLTFQDCCRGGEHLYCQTPLTGIRSEQQAVSYCSCEQLFRLNPKLRVHRNPWITISKASPENLSWCKWYYLIFNFPQCFLKCLYFSLPFHLHLKCHTFS